MDYEAELTAAYSADTSNGHEYFIRDFDIDDPATLKLTIIRLDGKPFAVMNVVVHIPNVLFSVVGNYLNISEKPEDFYAEFIE